MGYNLSGVGDNSGGGIVGNIINMIHGFKDRAAAAHEDAAMSNYMNDPGGTIKALAQIDPNKAIALQQSRVAQQNAAQDRQYELQNRQRQSTKDDFLTMAQYLRGLPQGADYGAAVDSFAPMLQASNIDPSHVAAFRSAAVANPNFVRTMDDKAYEQWMKDQTSNTVAPVGSHVIRGGEVVDKVPFASKPVTARRGDGGSVVSIFNPNANDGSGAFVTGGAGGGPVSSGPAAPAASGAAGQPMSVDSLRQHFIDQESGGDYTKPNAVTGALGGYQLMPATAKTMSQRVGLPWRPDMMSQDTPAARRYQDALGGAAIQDAIDHSNGDPYTAAAYYYSGSSDPSHWGPKTRAYAQQMMSRFGAGGGSAAPAGDTITPTSISTAGRPAAPQTHAATREELDAAGYNDATAAQVDQHGNFKNIRYQPKPAANALTPEALDGGYQSVKSGINDMRQKLTELLNDPQLGSVTGPIFGRTGQYTGHGAYLHGLAKQIDANKLVTLLASLKTAGGNPLGSRVLKVEVEQLPKLLANLDFNQDTPDFRRAVQSGLASLDRLEQQTDAGYTAQRAALTRPRGQQAAPQQSGSEAPLNTIVRTPNGMQIKTAQGWRPYSGR